MCLSYLVSKVSSGGELCGKENQWADSLGE